MKKRTRRSFTKEYKAEVVELIRKSGKNVGAVARDLDLTETAVRRWLAQAEVDSGTGPVGTLTTAEEARNAWPHGIVQVSTESGQSQGVRGCSQSF